MQYNCGDCGIKTSLRRSDPIRCKECGCRVLYKERTKRLGAHRHCSQPVESHANDAQRMVQFEAR